MNFFRSGNLICWLLVYALLGGLTGCLPPRAGDIAKYQGLLDQGQVEECRNELIKTLSRKPNWHEGRAFLVQLELDSNNLTSATQHLILLAKAQYGTSQLEEALLAKGQATVFTPLREAWADNWPWPALMSLRLALLMEESEQLEAAFTWLWDHDSSLDLLSTLWQESLTGDLAAAWIISGIRGTGRNDVIQALYQADAQVRNRALARITDNHLELSVLRAETPTTLRVLEGNGFTPLFPELYQLHKTRVAILAEDEIRSYTPEELAAFATSPSQLMERAKSWLGQVHQPDTRGAVIAIAEYLETLPAWSRRAGNLKAVVNPTLAPASLGTFNPAAWGEAGYVLTNWALSPDGRYFFYTAEGPGQELTGRIVDLTTGKPLALATKPYADKIAWNSDGQYLALESLSMIFLYDLETMTEQILDMTSGVSLTLAGWINGNLVWWSDGGWLKIYSIAAQDTQTAETELGTMVQLTTMGKLSLLKLDGTALSVTLEGSGFQLQVPWGTEVLGWLPGDSRLLIKTPESYKILELSTGELMALDVLGFIPLAAGWLDEHRVVGHIPLGSGQHSFNQVAVLDIRDMSLTAVNLRYHQGMLPETFGFPQASVFIGYSQRGVDVYRLP